MFDHVSPIKVVDKLFVICMPTLSASTTAVFASVGLTAADIYDTFVGLIGTAVSFGLWLIQVSWPFLLVVGFIMLMWRLAHRFLGMAR